MANCLPKSPINCQILLNCSPASGFWRQIGEQWRTVDVHLANLTFGKYFGGGGHQIFGNFVSDVNSRGNCKHFQKNQKNVSRTHMTFGEREERLGELGECLVQVWRILQSLPI